MTPFWIMFVQMLSAGFALGGCFFPAWAAMTPIHWAGMGAYGGASKETLRQVQLQGRRNSAAAFGAAMSAIMQTIALFAQAGNLPSPF